MHEIVKTCEPKVTGSSALLFQSIRGSRTKGCSVGVSAKGCCNKIYHHVGTDFTNGMGNFNVDVFFTAPLKL